MLPHGAVGGGKNKICPISVEAINQVHACGTVFSKGPHAFTVTSRTIQLTVAAPVLLPGIPNAAASILSIPLQSSDQHNHAAAAATAAMAATSQARCPPRLLLPLDVAGAGAGAASAALPPASKLSASGFCCGAHCALGRVAGIVPISSSQPCTMLLAVGGTIACNNDRQQE